MRRSRALGIPQLLARSFRAVLALVALALVVALATFLVVLAVDEPALDRDSDGRTGARLAHQGMLDQETGVRGYLLTGDRSFLAPYQQGRTEVAQGDALLSASVGQNSQLAPLLLATRLAEQDWTLGWAQPLVAAPVPRGGVAPAELDRGKRLFDAYRTDNDRLTAAVSDAYDAVRRDEGITLRVSAALQLAVFAVVLVLTVREHRRLRDAVSGPLAALVAAIGRVRDGDLGARVAEEGPEDLRQVAAGLNGMARSVAEERSLRASRETEVMYQATKLREVLDMARDLAGSLNLGYVLEATATHAVSVSGFDRATVWLVDEDGMQLHARHTGGAVGDDEPRAPLALNQGCVGRAARFGQVESGRGGAAGDPSDARSLLAAPMIVGARVVGVIELSSTREYMIPPGALPILETLASHAGTAIEAARLHQRTEELSQVDALTRLYNRRRLEDDLQREHKSARRYDRSLAFSMLDVDHFKRYNDRHGHQRGDEVLEEVARLLRTGIRASDSAYRYGGEEFALLLPDTPLESAVALCERLRHRIAGRFASGDAITASFGVAVLTPRMRAPADLVATSDRALYRAKAEGRDRVVAATDSDDTRVVELRPQ